MVTFQQMYANPSFEGVQEAAENWRKTAGSLSGRAEDFTARTEIHTWNSGDTAVSVHLAREEIAAQLAAASTEATAIGQILQYAYEELTAQNRRFQSHRAEVEAAGFPVYADGTIGIPPVPTELGDYPELSGEWVDHQRGLAVGHAEGFGEILIKATEVDESIEAALRTAVGYDAGAEAFNPAAQGDGLDIADQIADAQRAAELLRSSVDGQLTAEQLAELNALLAEHDGDATFATTLLNGLGPEGFVKALGSADLDAAGNDGLPELQRHLGENLALATDPGNQPHVDGAAWAAELNRLGTSEITLNHRDDLGNEVPYTYHGYQVFGPLLQYGEYDKGFLVPVVDGMADAYEARQPNWTLAKGPTGQDIPLTANPFDAANPQHVNPLNPGLIALSHNPESATAFYNLDGGKHIEGLIQGDGTFPHAMADGAVSIDLIGDSLEAATTGRDFDGPDHQERIPHTAEMAAVTGHLVTWVGEHAIRVEHEYLGMADSFGRITANYMEDFHTALSGADPARDGVGVSPFGVAVDFGAIGYDSDENPALQQWLQVIGHDQLATATVYGASEGLMLDTVMANGGDVEYVSLTADAHARIVGELTNGTLEGIRDEIYQRVDAHNSNVLSTAEAVKFGLGQGLAYTPMGPFAGTAVGAFGGYFIDSIAKQFLEDPSQEIFAGQNAARDQVLNQMLHTDGVPGRIRDALIAGGCPPDRVDDKTADVVGEWLKIYDGTLNPQREADGSDPNY